jgi:hypothetical protein
MNCYCRFDCLKGNIFITAGRRPEENEQNRSRPQAGGDNTKIDEENSNIPI